MKHVGFWALPAVIATSVFAHQGASGIVLERMQSMEALSTSMKALSPIVRGQAAFDADAISPFLPALSHLTAEQMVAYFPTGTDGGTSEAAETIWSDAAGFAAEAQAFEASVATLFAAVEAGDADGFNTAFRSVAGSCKSCHQSYRISK